jgi:hypothetical protein
VGLIDGLGDMHTTLTRRFGDKVRLVSVQPKRPAWPFPPDAFGMMGGGVAAGTTGAGGLEAGGLAEWLAGAVGATGDARSGPGPSAAAAAAGAAMMIGGGVADRLADRLEEETLVATARAHYGGGVQW